MQPFDVDSFQHAFNNDEVFAYPTEAVFGLGCNPQSKIGMQEILRLKVRPVEKGVILIASSIEQILPYVKWDAIPPQHQRKIERSWPGPFTWLMPKSDFTPSWVSGNSDLVAVRVTDHELVKHMCDAVGSALISTSANPAGMEPARSSVQVTSYFGNSLLLINGELGQQAKPSTIMNSLTLQKLR